MGNYLPLNPLCHCWPFLPMPADLLDHFTECPAALHLEFIHNELFGGLGYVQHQLSVQFLTSTTVVEINVFKKCHKWNLGVNSVWIHRNILH